MGGMMRLIEWKEWMVLLLNRLEHDQANLVPRDIGAPPVVHVKVQVAVARAELLVIDEKCIIRQIQRVHHIKALL